MPVLQSNAHRLTAPRLGTLCDVLNKLRLEIGDDAVVLTEVGLAPDMVLVGRRAMTVRHGFHIVVISSDQLDVPPGHPR